MSDFYWKEYPECDREYVRWYPCNVRKLNESEHIKKERYVFYVHLPFCNNVCSCCLYNKQNTEGELLEDYLTAIKNEILIYSKTPSILNAEFIAGYIGGGTPTVLSEKQLSDLLDFIKDHLNIKDSAPITVETTPVDITLEKAKVLLNHGVNRISVGVQSFNNELLKRIGRTHTAQKAIQTIYMLKSAGFKEINIDLMYALPGDSLEAWKKTLDQVDELNVESVSLYYYIQLPESRLTSKIQQGRIPKCPDEQQAEQLYLYGIQYLLEKGYVAVSPNDFGRDDNKGEKKWSQEGAVSFWIDEAKRYKVAMANTMERTSYISHCWYYNGPMLAFGAGAYGYMSNHIYFNQPDIQTYIDETNNGHLPVVMGAEVNMDEQIRRNMILAVKLLCIRRQDFVERYGIDIGKYFRKEIDILVDQGLVELTEDKLMVTFPKGWKYIDNISKMFYSENNYRLPQPAPTNTNLIKYLIG